MNYFPTLFHHMLLIEMNNYPTFFHHMLLIEMNNSPTLFHHMLLIKTNNYPTLFHEMKNLPTVVIVTKAHQKPVRKKYIVTIIFILSIFLIHYFPFISTSNNESPGLPIFSSKLLEIDHY